jgi:FixJ family two-component response regulator
LPLGDKDRVPAEVRRALAHRAPGPAAEAILKADYESWLDGLTPKERVLAERLEAGFNLTEIAQQQGVSKSATQAMRRTLAKKWSACDGYGRGSDR